MQVPEITEAICQLKGCIVWNDTIQYLPEAVSYPCTSCLLPAFDDAQCHVPVTEWCQRYLTRYLFSVSNSVRFSSIYRSPGSTSTAEQAYTIGFNMQYRTSNVVANLGRYVSHTERTTQGIDFESILNAKQKLDTPEKVSLEVNFRPSVIIAELWRPEFTRPGNFVSIFCVFWINDPYDKIFKILFRKFSLPLRSTLMC